MKTSRLLGSLFGSVCMLACVCGCCSFHRAAPRVAYQDRAEVTHFIETNLDFAREEEPRTILSEAGYDLTLGDYLSAKRDGNVALLNAYDRLGFPGEIAESNFITNLMWASFKGKLDLIRKLLARSKALINEPRFNQWFMTGCEITAEWTPLIMAVQADQVEAADLLLKSGADINYRPEDVLPSGETNIVGFTALFRAVDPALGASSRRMVEFLLDRGVDPGKNNDVLWLAYKSDQMQLLRRLLSEKEWCEQLNQQEPHMMPGGIIWDAAGRNDLKALEFLVGKGADCRVQGKGLIAALMRNPPTTRPFDATDRRTLKTIKFLVEHGCPVGPLSRNLLDAAMENDLTNCVKYLEERIAEFPVARETRGDR